jgi:hypothetical protein
VLLVPLQGRRSCWVLLLLLLLGLRLVARRLLQALLLLLALHAHLGAASRDLPETSSCLQVLVLLALLLVLLRPQVPCVLLLLLPEAAGGGKQGVLPQTEVSCDPLHPRCQCCPGLWVPPLLLLLGACEEAPLLLLLLLVQESLLLLVPAPRGAPRHCRRRGQQWQLARQLHPSGEAQGRRGRVAAGGCVVGAGALGEGGGQGTSPGTLNP